MSMNSTIILSMWKKITNENNNDKPYYYHFTKITKSIVKKSFTEFYDGWNTIYNHISSGGKCILFLDEQLEDNKLGSELYGNVYKTLSDELKRRLFVISSSGNETDEEILNELNIYYGGKPFMWSDKLINSLWTWSSGKRKYINETNSDDKINHNKR